MLDIEFIKSSEIDKFHLSSSYEVAIVLPMIDVMLAKKLTEVLKRKTKQSGVLIVVEDNMRLGFIMVSNLVYAKTASRYFSYIAQDAFPGEFWLDYGLETLRASKCGLLSFNDGRFFGKIAVFGLADRQWINTLYKKFLFYPQYKSHFADTELSVIAAQTGNLVFNPNSIVLEVDYEKHLHPNNKDDHSLYIERAKTGFDGRIAPFTPQ